MGMGTEQFYWFVDRASVDPVLEMTWKAFLRKYPWRRRILEEHFNFAVIDENDVGGIDNILVRKTLRWTVKHAQPAYYFLNVIVHHVPSLRRRCPEVWPDNLFEFAVLESTAVEAFLQGEIGARTLWAINNIDGAEDPRVWLELSRSDAMRVRKALKSGVIERPIFSWQDEESLNDGYRCLGVSDTKRFVDFLIRAWRNNWPVPRIRKNLLDTQRLVRKAVPRFRD